LDAARRIVLVTGASGFIGRHTLAPLLERDFEVHAVARELPANPGKVRWHAFDLLTPGAAAQLIESVRPTHLLHLAWYAEHGKFWNSPLNLDWLSATLALIRAFADRGGERFVGAGTCAEYDWGAAEAPLDEKASHLRPSTLYGAAKASAFLSAQAYAVSVGCSFAWGRVFHLFGPGEDERRIIPLLIRAHLKGERLDCGSGTQLRDFLPVASVAEAFAAMCASDVSSAVNIGSGQAMSLENLSDRIAALAGRRGEVRFGVRNDSGPRVLIPEMKLLGQTGWQSPESLDESLALTLDWWESRLI
jgi:nucleoside-diphosphate-sugar epimerase